MNNTNSQNTLLKQEIKYYLKNYLNCIVMNSLYLFFITFDDPTFYLISLILSTLFLTFVIYPFSYFFIRFLYVKKYQALLCIGSIFFLVCARIFFFIIIDELTNGFDYNPFLISTINILFYSPVVIILITMSIYFFFARPKFQILEGMKGLKKENKRMLLRYFPYLLPLITFTKISPLLIIFILLLLFFILSIKEKIRAARINKQYKKHYTVFFNKYRIKVATTVSDFFYKDSFYALMKGKNKPCIRYTKGYCSMYSDYLVVPYTTINHGVKLFANRYMDYFLLECQETDMLKLSEKECQELLRFIQDRLQTGTIVHINYYPLTAKEAKKSKIVSSDTMSDVTNALMSMPLNFHNQAASVNHTNPLIEEPSKLSEASVPTSVSLQAAVDREQRAFTKELGLYFFNLFICLFFNVLIQAFLSFFQRYFLQRLLSSTLFLVIVCYPFTFFFIRLLYVKYLRPLLYLANLVMIWITWKIYMQLINAISMIETRSFNNFLYYFKKYNETFLEEYFIDTTSTHGLFFTILSTLMVSGPMLLLILFSLYFYNSHPNDNPKKPKSLIQEMKLELLKEFSYFTMISYFVTRINPILGFFLSFVVCIAISLINRNRINDIEEKYSTYSKSSNSHQLAVTCTLTDLLYKDNIASLMAGIDSVLLPFAHGYCSLYEDYIFVPYRLLRNTKEVNVTNMNKLRVFILEYGDYEMKDLSKLQQEEVLSRVKDLLNIGVRVFVNYRCNSKKREKISADELTNMSLTTKTLRSLPVTFHRQTDRNDYTELKRFIRAEVYQNTNSKLSGLLSELFFELPLDNKFSFIVHKISNISINNATEAFYDIMRLSEYMMHYRALYKLSHQLLNNPPEITFSMGSWQSLQEESNISMESDTVLESVGLIVEVLSGGREQAKKRVNYNDICRLLVRLRNKYIGHGTLTYSISDELLNATVILTGKVYEVFLRDGYQLTKDCFISKEDLRIELQGLERVACCNLEEPLELLFKIISFNGMLSYEYIDYITGKITTVKVQEEEA